MAAGRETLADATAKLVRGLLEAFILDSIARQPKHGYALIQELEEVFGEPPNRNQVYPLLNRLESEGFLRADRSEGRGRTRYALTGKGLELLKEYRLRTASFRGRVASLWGVEEAVQAMPGEGPACPAQRSLEPVAPGRLAPAQRGQAEDAGGHAGGPCTAELVFRRPLGRARVLLEAVGLDASCPTCAELMTSLRALRERWL